MRPEEIAHVVGDGTHGGAPQEGLVGGVDRGQEGAVGGGEDTRAGLEDLVEGDPRVFKALVGGLCGLIVWRVVLGSDELQIRDAVWGVQASHTARPARHGPDRIPVPTLSLRRTWRAASWWTCMVLRSLPCRRLIGNKAI